MRETDIGRATAAYLSDLGWALSFEVEVPGLSGRPDIVGTRGPLTIIVECKTSIGIAVMGQAYKHVGHASYVCVATPHQHTRERHYVESLLRRDGIGWILAGDHSTLEVVSPRLYRRASAPWRSHLKPEHADSLPGSSGGGYWTPFAETCRNVKLFLQRHPDANTSAVVRGIKHHYRTHSTAVSCLARWGRQGVIPGVVVDGNTWRLAEHGAAVTADGAR